MERHRKSNRTITLYATQNQEVSQEQRDTLLYYWHEEKVQGQTPFDVQGKAYITEEELKKILKLTEILAKELARKHSIYYIIDKLISIGRYAVEITLRKLRSRSHFKKIQKETISFWRRWTNFSRTHKRKKALTTYLEEVFQEN